MSELEPNDLEQTFIKLAVQYASPYSFSSECSSEIELIIQKGVSKLKDVPDEMKQDKITKAQESLKLLIEEMKKNAIDMDREQLTPEDLEHAKKKICPTWPCNT